MTMNKTKQEAMQQLLTLQAEVEKLKAIIEKPDEVEVFQGRYLREGLGEEHWCFDVHGDYRYYKNPSDVTSKLGLCFASEEAAKQHREHLRLMQEARVAMAKSWGNEEVDWANQSQYKWCIELRGDELKVIKYITTFHKLHFRTQADASDFLASWHEAAIKSVITGG